MYSRDFKNLAIRLYNKLHELSRRNTQKYFRHKN